MADEPRFVGIPQLNEHARAIGHVCILWAWVENAIELFLTDLAFGRDKKAGKVVLANLDMRKKGQILKMVALAKKPTDRWYEGVQTHSRCYRQRSAAEAKPLRARSMVTIGETVQKRWKRAKGKRPQAHHAYDFSTREDAPVDAAEIWDLADLMVHVMIELWALHHEYLDGAGRAARRRRTASPQLPRVRFGRPNKSDAE